MHEGNKLLKQHWPFRQHFFLQDTRNWYEVHFVVTSLNLLWNVGTLMFALHMDIQGRDISVWFIKFRWATVYKAYD